MKRRLVLIAVIIPLLIAAALMALFLHNRAEAKRTEELLAQWQAAGGALTLADLKPEPIPDDFNAAVLYTQAFGELGDWTDEQYDLVSDLVLNETSLEVLSSSHRSIELAIEAGQRPACQWESRLYVDGLQAHLPHLAQSRRLAKLMVLAIERAVADADYPRAMLLVESLRRLAYHNASEQTMISALIGMAIDTLALEALQRHFKDRSLPPDHEAEPLSGRTLPEATIRRAVIADTVVMWKALENESHGMLQRRAVRRELDYSLRVGLILLDELDKPYQERDWNSAADRLSTQPPGSAYFESQIRFCRQSERHRRFELTAQTAIRLRRYRDEHGHYPDPADWGMPIDPLSGQPMIYRRTDAGFEITGSLENDEHPLSWQWQ